MIRILADTFSGDAFQAAACGARPARATVVDDDSDDIDGCSLLAALPVRAGARCRKIDRLCAIVPLAAHVAQYPTTRNQGRGSRPDFHHAGIEQSGHALATLVLRRMRLPHLVRAGATGIESHERVFR